ncbi:Protein PBDC1, metazoa/fungi like protein [Aduncisulcus paluster]|uniref:Protein PBDC1, metazoa/fungi like protein n=1 Tax=Aduncisulcus paluster TaxID=2918883 RepID=A0ABQ5K101_9EUKA|nr:Protein PBDC1, metazoa/fungi like protein [Aduncisulcus paluster]|eukprot:gnl/Carplike_NY0171/2367_a3189_753.p1 GENE.gnl/Carplike_NY0171/2367_a3189_753~~gnl/Carplike_NY0171/2367_a3189_753.p1  ORF type:complete len:179 (+),score=37.20 gnl/Carplike_NY0171/2367_a3189_753:47-583(+)
MSRHIALDEKQIDELADKTRNPFPEGVKNDAEIEMKWAKLAFNFSYTFYNVLLPRCKDLKKITLTPIDEEIYSKFRSTFPSLDISVISEDLLKSSATKTLWALFLEHFKERISQWNMGSLVRLDSSKPWGEDNCTLVPRIQFYCIEIARNREGINQLGHLKTSIDSTKKEPKKEEGEK